MNRFLRVVMVMGIAEVAHAAFSDAEKLSAPHCAQLGVEVKNEGSWRAVANTALQCQRACATATHEGGQPLSLFSGALNDGQSCSNFTFYTDTKLCYLNPRSDKQAKSTKAASNAISGPKDCPPETGSSRVSMESLLFIPGATHFNGQSQLFNAAVQASQFAARRAVEDAKDASISELLTSGSAQQSFTAIDLDQNGVLEPHEFWKASKASDAEPGGVPISLLEKVDLNKDSKVDLVEFQQALEGHQRSLDQIVSLASGVARSVALKGGLSYVQQEICAAAAAAAAGVEEGRLQGKDLKAQSIEAVDAVAADLPKNQQVALSCLAASFSAGLAVAGANSSIEAARQAAWRAMVQSDWNETQRQEVAAQVAGLTAGLHAQAKHSHPYVIRQAVEQTMFGSLGGTETESKCRLLIEHVISALATEWKVENSKHITDPSAANLVWAGEAFHQAFQAVHQQDRPSSAAQRAADFLSAGHGTTHLSELHRAAEAAREMKVREGASVVEQAAAAAKAVKKEAEKLNISSTVEEERLVLGAVGAAVRLGAPEAQSEELAGLVEKAAAKEGFTKLAQAEAGAWASATAESAEATTGELSADTFAAMERPTAARGKALRGVRTAAASVAIDGSWHSKNDLGDLMKSEESFEKEMSTRLGREDLVRPDGGDDTGDFRFPLWLPMSAALLCCFGMVLGLLTWKQKKTKKSQRMASLEINYQEVQDALNCKDCEEMAQSEAVPSPVASLGASSPLSSRHLDIPSEALASPTSMSPTCPEPPSPGKAMASPRSEAADSSPRPCSPALLPQQPGPLLISYPDWQQSWQPGEQKEVNYQVPAGARPGATLLVDVGGGLAVPTIVPESAYAGLTLSLRR